MFGTNYLEFEWFCPQNGIAVLIGLIANYILTSWRVWDQPTHFGEGKKDEKNEVMPLPASATPRSPFLAPWGTHFQQKSSSYESLAHHQYCFVRSDTPRA